MNVVHDGVRHLALVPADRRARRRDQRRQQILDAADELIAEHGIEGITMQRVADHLDCAVGTLYLYVPSKAALVTALQARAVATLRASYATVQATWAAVLDEAGHGSDPALEPGLRALVELCAFSAHWIAASVVLADEFRLQRTLLTERTSGAAGADETREVLAAVDALLAVPTGLLDAAATAGVLRPGSARERALRWVAALNGVLLLDQLSPLDRHLFRAAPLARQLSDDLLRGWGAADADLDVADVHVQRLAARGPMAPPPGAPSPGPA